VGARSDSFDELNAASVPSMVLSVGARITVWFLIELQRNSLTMRQYDAVKAASETYLSWQPIHPNARERS